MARMVSIAFAVMTAGAAMAATWYVDASNPLAGNGSVGNPFKQIQSALAVAGYDDIISVADGTYTPISTSGARVLIQSVNGPGVTFINGGNANRCATLSLDTVVLSGFTLTNGNAATASSYPGYGGGALGGTLTNCVVVKNTATQGGGARGSTLANCIVAGNTANNGGGVSHGTLANCTLTNNLATFHGGGAYYSTLNNCILSGNTATLDGGGAYGSMLNSCLLTGNTAVSGGGVYGDSSNRSTVRNCTVTGNKATGVSSGGGIFSQGGFNVHVYNSIVWGNTNATTGTASHNYDGSCVFTNSCTSPSITGTGNISTDPMFVDAAAGNFHLQSTSLCKDAGNNTYVISGMTTDLDGKARIVGGIVDMGAYEYAPTIVNVTFAYNGVTLPYTYGQPYGPLLVLPPRDGYTFLGWYTASVGGTLVTSLTIVTNPNNHTLYDRWRFETFYVDDENGNDFLNNGRSWRSPFKSIQTAVDAIPGAGADNVIHVGPGTYAPISTANKKIAIRSADGPGATTIDGNRKQRCATLGAAGQHNTILQGFTLTRGLVTGNGGGALGGTLVNCILTGNTATDNGGGACRSILLGCLLAVNGVTDSGSNGGGASGCALVNCTVAGNMKGLNRSTLAGVHDCEVVNSIIWGNDHLGLPDNWDKGSTINYSCTTPFYKDTGNIEDDPMFVNAATRDFRLSLTSPCINAGFNKILSNFPMAADDLDGTFRIIGPAVDMGAYEFPDSALFVSDANGSDTRDGRSWATAKKTIQGALGIAVAGERVAVADGTYFGSIVRTDNAAITIQSINGASVTIIGANKGARCATLGNGGDTATVLTGFTLQNGSAALGGGSYAGTLNHCILTGNTASGYGGGAYRSTLNHCILTGNTAGDGGGGAAGSTLNNCTLTGNTAGDGGGGAAGSTLNNCTLTGNQADYGGGADFGTLNHCTLTGNQADYGGGGAFGSEMNNCLLTGNTAQDGGGAYDSILRSCTVTGNTATGNGGGVYAHISDYTFADNSIVWGNILTGGGTTTNYNASCTFETSCAFPLPAGLGNTGLDPKFVNAASGNYRLRPGSPCIDTGNGAYASWAFDLDGNDRIIGPRVDMGAYEFDPTAILPASLTALRITSIILGGVSSGEREVTLKIAYEGAASLDGVTLAVRYWDTLGDAGALFSNPSTLLDNRDGTAQVVMYVDDTETKAFFRIEAAE